MILVVEVVAAEAPAGWVADMVRLFSLYPGNQEARLLVRMADGEDVSVTTRYRVDGWNRRLRAQIEARGGKVTEIRNKTEAE